MKLRLETAGSSGEVTVLTVTEDVTAQHGAIIKAGLMKLIKTGKKKILVDVLGVTQADPAILKLLSQLHTAMKAAQIDLVVASAQPGIGQATSLAAALALFSKPAEAKPAPVAAPKPTPVAVAPAPPPVAPALSANATEEELQARQQLLEKRKGDLNQRLAAMSGGALDVKALRQEQSSLKELIREYESQARLLLKARKAAPFAPDSKQLGLEKTLRGILDKEGLLKA